MPSTPPAPQMALRSYLVLLIVGSMLPFLVVSGLLLKRILDDNRMAVERTLVGSARQQAAALDAELSATTRALQLLSGSPFLERDDLPRFEEVARRMTRTQNWMAVRLLTTEPRVVVDTGLPPNLTPTVPVADPESVMEVIRTGATVVGRLSTYTTGVNTLAVRVPVRRGGDVHFVLSAVLTPDVTTQLPPPGADEPQELTRSVVDTFGTVVARTRDPQWFVGRRATPDFIDQTAQRTEGLYRERAPDGAFVYVAFAHSTIAHWTFAVTVPVMFMDGASRRSMSMLFAVALLVLTAGGGGAYWLSGRIASDIRTATLAAEALARGEQAPAATSIVGDLTRLRQALAQSGALLRDRSAERDSHLARAEAALAHAEQSNAVKDQFLAMLGHELRNPLAPIRTALDVLKLRGSEWSHEHAVIRRQVEHMSRLVDDLLDVSRITRRSVELRKTRTLLSDVIARATEMTAPLLEEHRHHLTVDVPGALAVDGDATRLAQIFGNLMSNAARYTPDGGAITVRARQIGSEIAIEVIDNGRGIPAELAPRIFEMFVQGSRTIDRQEGGMGLGLAIARSLVTLHDGRIEVHSDGEGRGSTFTVHLPAASDDLPADGLLQGEQAGHPLRVLIVDDNADAAEMLAMLLTGAGHEVATAPDGPQALLLVAHLKPDVAVLDLGLPVMDGYELALRIRAAMAPDPPVLVAVTGYGQAEDLARSRDAGFACHLVKPVNGDDLLGLLGTIALLDARG